MGGTTGRKRVAIACQGGGSHTAFTAGVLVNLLRSRMAWRERYEPVALSGTSGGAICALLAWSGLVEDDWDAGAARLEGFWRDNAATEPWDVAVNAWTVWLARVRDVVSLPQVSAYAVPSWGQDRLRRLLERRVDFGRLASRITESSPALLVSAVDVLSGAFRVFENAEVTVEAVLASAAVPPFFRAVRVDGGLYWDGLFSQNPPVRDLLAGRRPESKPDEIWVIRIEPQARASEPRRLTEMIDRRNELAGNLSLAQELDFVATVNEWLADGTLSSARYRPVAVRTIALGRDLDVASKFDRTPAFIAEMMRAGEQEAAAFFAGLP
ncbi:MAG: patatin-like phospholipase family protein [Candidatus Rokuibacteriota bacterium]